MNLDQSIISSNKGINRESFSIFALYILVYGGYIKLFFPIVSTVVIVLQVAVMILSILLDNKVVIGNKKSVIVLSIMLISIVLMSLGFFYTSDVEIARNRLTIDLSTILYIIIIYIIASRLDVEKLNTLIQKFMRYNIILISLYFVLYIGIFISGLSVGGRLGDVVGNAIWLGRLCSEQIMLILISNNWKLSRVQKLLFVLLSAICVFTGSKGPIVVVFVVLTLYYIKITSLSPKKIAITIMISLALLAVFYAISNASSTFIVNRFSLGTMMASGSGYRVSRYTYTIQAIPEHLVMGHGLGSWSKNYWASYGVTSSFNDYPHNILLELLYENGIVVTFIWLLSVFLVWRAFKIVSRERIYVLWLLLIMNVLFGFFSGSIIDGNRGIYYFFAICVALIPKLKKYDLLKEKV